MVSTMGGYAGDLGVLDVWKTLESDAGAVLVDVRTRPEWSFVGLPDLRSVGKTPVLIEWQTYPYMEVNAGFVEALTAEFARRGLAMEAPVLFLCRSGARSQSAAAAAAANGFPAAYNVAGGFEGPLGSDGRRGSVDGWKARGLPWVRS
jgi:rhodanese-related sulfurtransferase